MSHDRGCPCGRERWEYANCRKADCIRNGHMGGEGATVTESIAAGNADSGHVQFGLTNSGIADDAPPGSVPLVTYKVRVHCPHCGERHVEQEGGDPEKRWERRAHTTHRCRACGGDFNAYVSGASDEELEERRHDG